MMDTNLQSIDDFDRDSRSRSSSNNSNHLSVGTSFSMERSTSSNTLKFRNNYDALLKEVLEETSEDESEDLLNNIEIDVNAATAELPDELRAALEDRALADKYLANLKSYMSHRRSHSIGSTTSLKGDYSSPNTPIQSTFPQPQKPFFRAQPDPLSKILDAVPYHTRLVNGVQPLTILEQKFHALRIPELDLPSVAEGIIQSRLGDLYKIQDELNIHLHGGPLVKNTSMAYKIGEKKKHKVVNLLDEISKEIGLYEEFVKRAQYLTLENILKETDSDDEHYVEDYETLLTDSNINHFESSSDISRATPGTPVSPGTFSPTPPGITSKTPRRISSNPALSSLSSSDHPHQYTSSKLTNGSRAPSPAIVRSSTSEQDNASPSRQSSEFGTFASDRSPSSPLLAEDVEPWEAFKWTSLKKISDQLYADDMRRHNGLVSVLAVSGVIAIGTTRSLVFVYDYSQNLKCILGDSARAVEIGSVTSLAISADHTTIACGHSQGYIVVWDINKPSNPVRVIDPIPASQATKSLNAQQQHQQNTLRKEGHVKGAAILHIGFVGVKKTEIVSGDDQGMSFYHVLYKVVMVNAVDTTRILGRYQNLYFPGLMENGNDSNNSMLPKPRRPSTVFAMQPLPLGQVAHPAENFGLIALLTPYKMIIVGLKPTPQTQYKYLKPKSAPAITTSSIVENGNHQEAESRQPSSPSQQPQQQSQQQQSHQAREDIGNSSKSSSENLAGCLAWLPVMKSDMANEPAVGPKDKNSKHGIPPNDPMLAFSWGNHLTILRVGIESPDNPQSSNRGVRNTSSNKNKRGSKLEFTKYGEYKCRDVIVGLQWINRQILVLITPNEEMILFDPKNMQETERASIRNKQLVYHDRFNSPLGDLVTENVIITPQQPGLGITDVFMPYRTVEMAYYHSLRAYKGKLFMLGLNKLYIGALLSWADRIIALVRAGDFLEGIELATLFYNGKYTQTVVGLPEDEKARKHIVGEKLKELLDASLNYTFSSTRTYEGMADESTSAGGGGAVLFKDLASGCIKACFSMDNLEYLFDVAYDRFSESNVRGIFLEVLEPYILQDKVSDIPPAVMKDLVNHYCSKRMLSQLEQVIWHVNPSCLDIDQIVSVCHREGLYEAMMYVWNKSMDDYVSPVVEMLKVVRSVIKDESTRLVIPQQFQHEQQIHFYPNGEHRSRMASAASGKTLELMIDEPEETTPGPRANAEKLFDYFKMILTGRTFPDGLPMTPSKANEARSAVYSFIFSGRCVIWPKIGGSLVLTADDEDQMSEPTYPYLRLLLRFSTKKFLEALEIAFEDPWLNGGDDILTSTLEEDMQGKVMSRQIIINTLLDVMGGGHSGNGLPLPPPRPKQSISASTVQSFSNSNRGTATPTLKYDENDSMIQLYMFIASNLHKYTTFILLPPTTLHNILVKLADDHDPDTRQERQAAVQNLLTVYKPMNPDQMVAYYEDAGFWQVLESVYRRDKKYGKLIEANLKDEERRTQVFDTVYRLLDDRGLNDKKKGEVKSMFMIWISQFVEIDGQRTAEIVETFFQGKHEDAIRRLEEDQEFDNHGYDDDDDYRDNTTDQRVFLYLRGLLEPIQTEEDDMEMNHINNNNNNIKVYAPPTIPSVDPSLHERYLELMCRFDPSGVFDYLNTKLVNDVNLKVVFKSCEEYEVIDAVVWIMEKSGNTQGALDKMLSVAKEKVEAILQIVRDHAQVDSVWTFEEQGIVSSCLIGLNGVLRVGTRLCENSSSVPTTTIASVPQEEVTTHDINSKHHDDDDHVESLWFRLLDSYVESSIEVLNALAAATIPQGLQQHIESSFKSFVQSILTHLLLSTSPQVSLPRLLSRLIESQVRGENTFADFRDIFRSMLDTYKYEGKLLEMTNRLFDRDLFKGVEDMVRGKERGWRPRRAVCDICGEGVLDLSLLEQPLAWNLDENQEDEKEKAQEDQEQGGGQEVSLPNVKVCNDVIVFRCKHAYHKRCLESNRPLPTEDSQWQCVICHHGEQEKEDQRHVEKQQRQQPLQEPVVSDKDDKGKDQDQDPKVEEPSEEDKSLPPPLPRKESKGKERATALNL